MMMPMCCTSEAVFTNSEKECEGGIVTCEEFPSCLTGICGLRQILLSEVCGSPLHTRRTATLTPSSALAGVSGASQVVDGVASGLGARATDAGAPHTSQDDSRGRRLHWVR